MSAVQMQTDESVSSLSLQVSGITPATLSPDCADEQLFWMALSDLEMSRCPVRYFSSRLTSGCEAVHHKFLLSPCYFCRAGVTVAPRAMEEMSLHARPPDGRLRLKKTLYTIVF